MQSVRRGKVVDDSDVLLQLDKYSDKDMKNLIADCLQRKYQNSDKIVDRKSEDEHDLIKAIAYMKSSKEASASINSSDILASKGRAVIASSAGGAGIGGAIAGIPGAIVGAMLAGAFTLNTSRSKKE